VAATREGIGEAEFLAMPPVALDALVRSAAIEALRPAAMICAAIMNTHNDYEKRPQGWSPADFLPGAEPARDESMDEFVEKVQRGEKFEPPPPEVMDAFRDRMASMFGKAQG
jgi:hypothetical protein